MGNRIIAGLPGLITPAVGAFPGIIAPIGPASGGEPPPSGQVIVGVVQSPALSERYGYQVAGANSYGTITPDPFDVNGFDLFRCYYLTGSSVWVIGVDDAGAAAGQDLWTSIVIDLGGGAEVEFESANADNFTNAGGVTSWEFIDAVNVWDSGDDGQDRGVDFFWP